MAGPIARAYVEVIGNADEAAAEIQADLRRAFDGIDAMAREAGQDITQAFVKAGTASRQALEEIDPHFGDISREAQQAGRSTAQQFIQAAARINYVLDTIGETAFDDLPEDAKAAATQVTLTLSSASRVANAALDAIGEGAFDDLDEDAQSAALDVLATLNSVAATADAVLDAIGETAFDDLLLDAQAVANQLIDIFVTTGALSEEALERIGGDAFIHIAEEAVLSSEAMVVAYVAGADIINKSLKGIGGAAFADLTGEAEAAALAVQSSMQGAAAAAQAAFQIIGEGAFDDLGDDAQVAGQRVRTALTAAAVAARQSLEAIGRGAFEEAARLAEISAQFIAAAYTEASAVSEEALERIGGDALLEVAAQAQASAAALGVAFVEAAAVAEAALETIEPDTGGLAAQGAAAGFSYGLAFREAMDAATKDAGKSLVRESGIIGNQLRRAMGNIVQASAVTAAFGAIAGTAAFVGFGIKATAEFERVTLGIENLVAAQKQFTVGSQEAEDAAAGLISQIKELALRTPFSFQGLAANVQQLLAAGRDAVTVVQDAEALGGVAAALGGKPEDLQFVIRALSQMNSSSRVYQQDLNQIIQRLPGFNARMELAFVAGAEAIDMSATAMQKLRAEGLDTAEALELIASGEELIASGALSGKEGVDALMTAMENFPGAAAALEVFAGSLVGQFERLKESIQFALVDGFEPLAQFLSGGAEGVLSGEGFLDDISESLEIGIAEMGRGVTDAVKRVGPAFLDLFDSLAPVLAELASAFGIFLEPVIDAIAEFLAGAGPQLGDTFENVAEALGKITGAGLQGALSVLEAMLPILDAIAAVITSIPDSFIQIAAIGYILQRNVIGPLSSAIGLARTLLGAIAKVATDTGVSKLTAGVGVLKSLMAGLATPGGIATAGALVVSSAFLFAITKAREEAAEYKREIEDLSKSFGDVIAGQADFNAVLDDFISKRLGEDASDDMLETLNDVGIGMQAIRDSIKEGGDALDPLRDMAKELGTEMGGIDVGKLDDMGVDATTLGKDLGLATGELEGLIESLEDYDQQVQAAARSQLVMASTSADPALARAASEALDEGAANAGNYAAALDGVADSTARYAEELMSTMSLNQALDAGIVAAQEAYDGLQETLDGFKFPDAMTEAMADPSAGGFGLMEEQIESLANVMLSDGVNSAQELANAMEELGIDASATTTAVAAALENITARVEEANAMLARLDPTPALAKVDEFAETMKDSFGGSATVALDSFRTNYMALLDGIIAETNNVKDILAANLEGTTGQLVEGLVRSFQGTGPNGALFIQGLADLIGDPAALEEFIGPLRTRFETLGEELQVDFLAALQAGTVTPEDLKLPTDVLKAKIEEDKEIIEGQLDEITSLIGTFGRGLGVFTEKGLEEARAQEAERPILGAFTRPSQAPADIVTEQLGPVEGAAKTAGDAAGKGFTETFSKSVAEGFETASGSIATQAQSALNLAFVGISNAFIVGGFGLAVTVSNTFAALGTAAGQAFGFGAALSFSVAVASLGPLVGNMAKTLGTTLINGLVLSIMGAASQLGSAMKAVGTVMTVGLSVGVLRAIAAANQAVRAGFAVLTATVMAATAKMSVAFAQTFRTTASAGLASAIATVTAVAVVGMVLLGLRATAALGAALSAGIAAVRGVVVAAIGQLTAIMSLMLVTGSIIAATQGTAALAKGLAQMATVAAAAGRAAGAAFALALATSLVTGTYAAARAASGAMVAAMAGIAGAAASMGRQAGLAFGVGLAAGIRASAYLAAAAAASAVFAAVAATRAAFRIGSPSKVGIEIGNRFGEGLAIGIEGLIGDVRDASTRLSVAAIRSLDSLSAAKLSAGSFSVQGTRSQRVQQVEIVGGMPRVITEPQQTFNFPLNVPVPDPEKIAFALGPQVARRVNHGGFVDV